MAHRAATLLLILAACGADRRGEAVPGPSKRAAAVSSSPSRKALPAAPSSQALQETGSIEGRVVLAAKAELPEVADDPKAGGKFLLADPPAPCTALSADDRRPVKRDPKSGGLSFVHVAVTGMTSPAAAALPVTHELRLVNCRIDRPLVAARVGDKVRLVNASGVPLFPGKAGDAVMTALLAGESRTIELPEVGVTPLACRFGAYCGRSEVLVTSHSLAAVTDAKGHFRIEGVPLGTDLTVHAWHPLFEEAQASFTLSQAAREEKVSLTLKPAKARAVRAPVPTKTGEPVVQ